jgi:hypothetical protein
MPQVLGVTVMQLATKLHRGWQSHLTEHERPACNSAIKMLKDDD